MRICEFGLLKLI